jgi:predicted N-formylglutamate amidohydrolase
MARQHLNSHRGWDPGSLDAARFLQQKTGAPLIHSTTTRLLVDLNRSLGNTQLFSRFSKSEDAGIGAAIIEQHYRPYRSQVLRAIQTAVDAGSTVLHISVHTFTPVYQGSRRKLDVGLLFDPDRTLEASVCSTWQRILRARDGRLRVELNQPYLGVDDGLTTAMRVQFPNQVYAGIELEINNQVMRRSEQGRRRLWQLLYSSLTETLAEFATA